MPPPPRRPLALGLWVGLAVALARGVVLFGMERFGHGMGAALARTRLANAAPEVLAIGLAIGAVGAGAVFLARRSRLALGAVAVALASVCTLFWSGRLEGDATRLIGVETQRGQLVTAVLFGGALVAGGLFVFLATRKPAASRDDARGARSGAWTPALIALALAFGLPTLLGRTSSSMPIREVVRDLVEREPEWLAANTHPKGALRAGILCPSADFRVRGGDLPALILPPPGEARFRVEAPDAPAALALRVGFDAEVVRAGDLEGHALRFEIAVDDAVRFTHDIPVEQVGEQPGSEWHDVPELPLMPGAEVTLRTTLLAPDGTLLDAAATPRALDAGFGELRLVRDKTRPREVASPEAPNVILIVMDTLRADRTSAYGYNRPTTPALERLAARGLRYAEPISSSSWTWPSTASILTGLHPLEHGVRDESSCHLAESLVTLPEVLQERGWTTAAWSGNLLIVPDKGFGQGFEHFEHAVGNAMPSKLLMPAALEWIESVGDTRFLLYLQMMDPHSPLDPSADARAALAPDVPADFSRWAIEDYKWELIGNCGHDDRGAIQTDACVPLEHQDHISDLYDACIRDGDDWLGVLLDRLDELGLTENTVVIFTSDHGEEMFEHGQLSHSQSLYQASVRVPLVLAGPGIPKGAVAQGRVENRHLAATIAKLCGAPWPTAEDALDLTRPEALPNRDVLVSTRQGWWNGVYSQQLYALLRGDRALHVAPEGGLWGAKPEERTGDWALFDVSVWPEVRIEPVGAAADLADELKDELTRRAEELSSRRATRALGAGGSTIEMLRGIGYIGDD